MKVIIWMFAGPGKNTADDTPKVTKMRARLDEMFAAYRPRRMSDDPDEHLENKRHELTVTPDDAEFERLLQKFRGEVKGAKLGGGIIACLEPAEVKRARFLEAAFYGDQVDCDARWNPLNKWPKVLCDVCKFPDITAVPKPFLVSRAAMKKQDLYEAGPFIIAKAHAHDLLKKIIPGQFESGEAQVQGVKEKPAAADRLYWILPKATIGNESNKTVRRRCKTCGRNLDERQRPWPTDAKEPGLLELRNKVEHFGYTDADLALVGGFYGSVNEKGDGVVSWYRHKAISGRLFTFLKESGIKGMLVSQSPEANQFYISEAGEPTMLAADVKGFAPATTAKPTKAAASPAMKKKPSDAFAKVPWDFDKDGYVYFQLTSPRLILLDPMTWEQCSGGPYEVKKYKKPGLYRLHASAVRAADGADGRGVAVDSATLLLVDDAAFADLQEVYSWDDATAAGSAAKERKYHAQLAADIGSRFGVCTTPPKKFKSQFIGDGEYTIDADLIEPARMK
jgi:hypothetical protein